MVRDVLATLSNSLSLPIEHLSCTKPCGKYKKEVGLVLALGVYSNN